ncbi:MAG: type II secretion system F family protein [Lachnospiraceae bacterium]|nr:type II secretion system F family protein [Lachnospiraceae bacterium]
MKSFLFSNMAIADLCQQLALLLQAGVRLSDGLFLLSEEEKDPQVQTILSAIATQVDQGISLSAAFQQAGCFPSHVSALLAVGEQVGRTEETLLTLSRYYEEQERMNRQLRSALTYPSILVLIMLVVIIVLLSKVLPVFHDVYASLGGSLTGIAGGLLALGNLLNAIMPFLGVALAAVVLAVALFSLVPWLRSRILRLWRRHLGDRGISRKRNDARFAQALSMAFSSGLPLEEGITLAATLLSDCPAAVKRSEDCRTRLEAGEDLASALGQSAMLPPSACRMLTLAMRAGTGDSAMQEISCRLSEEAQEALEARVAAIEPAMVLITSLLVGAILLSVMLPLMNIMKAIG